MRIGPSGLAVATLIMSCSSSTGTSQNRVETMPPQPSASAIIDRLKCTSFRWKPLPNGGDRGSMHIPVVIDGKEFEFQLDTGADESILYGKQAEANGWAAAGQRKFRPATVEVGGTSLARPEIYVLEDQGPTGGTVGLSFLAGKVSVIDYPGKRFCLMDAADVPDALISRTKWSGAILRNAKLFVPITLGTERFENLFFDTGASLFPLMVDDPVWRKLTGLPSADRAVTKVTGTQWGKVKTWPGAPSRVPVELGPIRIPSPTVYTDVAEPDHFGKMGFNAQGLIGNALVWDRPLVIWMTHRVRLGIVE